MADCHSRRCTKCGETKPIDAFPLCRGKPRARCKPCHTADATAWAQKNHDAYKARLRKWHRENVQPRHMGPPLPAHILRQRKLAGAARWREQNRDRFREMQRAWAEANKHVCMEIVRRRQASKLRATPAWADRRAMQQFYAESKRLEAATGGQFDVDHIVPLQNKRVCGLHCEANLQVLPRRENRVKHNTHWPDMWPDV